MLVHCRVSPSIKFASTHLYTWVERGTVRFKCLTQEHNTMSLARAQKTLTVRSGDERINQVTMRTPRLFVPTLTLVKNILIGILWTYQFFFIFVCGLADSDQLSLFWSKIPFNPG